MRVQRPEDLCSSSLISLGVIYICVSIYTYGVIKFGDLKLGYSYLGNYHIYLLSISVLHSIGVEGTEESSGKCNAS